MPNVYDRRVVDLYRWDGCIFFVLKSGLLFFGRTLCTVARFVNSKDTTGIIVEIHAFGTVTNTFMLLISLIVYSI